MDIKTFIESLNDYCSLASKIYFYASNENGTRYVNFAFKVNGKNLKKNEADKLSGINMDDSIKKQKKYLDKLQTQFESFTLAYYQKNKKELSELKVIYDVKNAKTSFSIENDTFSGQQIFSTDIFDKWYKNQK